MLVPGNTNAHNTPQSPVLTHLAATEPVSHYRVQFPYPFRYGSRMHEFSICERIVEAVLDEYSRLDPAPCRLCKVRVVVGRLHQIVPEYLTFAYDALTRDTTAQGSKIELVSVPVVVRCRACGWDGNIELPLFRCGGCGSLDVEMLGGKELYLDHLEVEWGPDFAPGDSKAAYSAG